MPVRYKDIEECRDEIQRYAGQLEAATDNSDPERRDEASTNRYLQGLRWYDEWLDDARVDSPTTVTAAMANEVGQTLASEFSGSTGRYRWDRIYAFHDWLKKMELADENPFERWNEDKGEKFGLTKSTEQSRQLEDTEQYAVSQQEVREMEQNVGRYRTRDQLIIRLLWQTGLRRDEVSKLKIEDIDRESREITIRSKVAKNGNERVVGYQQTLDGLLAEWLDGPYRDEMAATTDHDRLFVGERGAPLKGARINDIVINAADEAGFNRKIYADANAPTDEDGNKIPNRWMVTAHNVRHGFGTYMVNKTDAGLWEVSNTMGHSSVKVTERIYVEDDPRAGVEHVHKYGPE